ncbi:MAG: hypothetical protein JST04_00485 [Bdellovibrionales bacterium]|nr:hypothetical protein [Bdellovibrionales bacterium]
METREPSWTSGDRFADRSEAGALLGERLRHRAFTDPIVLGLARGGVVVGYEIARRLGAPMEVLVARKIGAPEHPEYAIGAVVESGLYHLDTRAIESLRVPEDLIDAELEAARREIRRRVAVYRLDLPLPRVKGRDVLLVDDGIATGETARVACRMLRDRGARKIVLVAPVCPAGITRAGTFPEASELVVLRHAENFRAVGDFYARFPAVSDEAVLLLASRGRAPNPPRADWQIQA